MPSKTWKASYENLEIEVRNSWSFSGASSEQLLINGMVHDTKKSTADSGFKQLTSSEYELEVDTGGKSYLVQVKAGSKWLGLAAGCHIFVDGVLIGGDINSKLL